MIGICDKCTLPVCNDRDPDCAWREFNRRQASSKRLLKARRANIAIARHHWVEQAKLGFKKYDQRKRYAKRRQGRRGRKERNDPQVADVSPEKQADACGSRDRDTGDLANFTRRHIHAPMYAVPAKAVINTRSIAL